MEVVYVRKVGRADRESENGEHEEVPSDSAEPGKKAAMPST